MQREEEALASPTEISCAEKAAVGKVRTEESRSGLEVQGLSRTEQHLPADTTNQARLRFTRGIADRSLSSVVDMGCYPLHEYTRHPTLPRHLSQAVFPSIRVILQSQRLVKVKDLSLERSCWCGFTVSGYWGFPSSPSRGRR